MVFPGSAQPSEMTAARQALLREELRDPASVARADEVHQARSRRRELRTERHQRWATKLKQALKGRS
jgi:hypothetical protein